MKTILRVLSYMRSFWLIEAMAYLCMLGIAAVRLVRPQLIRSVVDVGIALNRPDVLAQSAALLLALTALRGLCSFGEHYLSEKVAQSIAYIMRNQVYHKLQRLSFSYHDRAQTGQLLSRATSDVERLRRLTGRGLLRLVDSLVLLVGTSVMLFRMHALLAALSLLLMPVIYVTMRRFIILVHPLWHGRQDQVAELTSRLEQNLRGVSVVRGFAQELAETERFDDQNETIYQTSMSLARAGARAWPFVFFLASVSSVMVLWFGGWLVIQGQLTLGELVAFNAYLMQLISPIRRLGFIMTMLGESRASAERVFEILDARSEVEDEPDAAELGSVNGEVRVEGALEHLLPSEGGAGGGSVGTHRLGQEHHHQPHTPLLRRD